MFKIGTYLVFNGNCEEALKLYESAFNSKATIMRFGENPNPEFPLPEDAKDLILHASLQVGESVIMFSDTLPNSPFAIGNNVTVSLNSKDINEIKSAYEVLSESGNTIMDLQETFFSKAYGMVQDKFGVIWQVIAEQ